MKRLDEVEPRTNLQATPAPTSVDTTNASYHFVINQPGSYYLSSNLGVTKANGIQINAEDVTLDLNGFAISRAGGNGGDGIQVAATAHRARILNGSLRGFAFGTNGGNAFSGPRDCKFRDLSISGCTSTAISMGPGALAESCQVHDNTGDNGFSSGFGSTLTNCVASHNTVTYAIFAAVGSTVTNCTASYNNCTFAIQLDSGSSLTNSNALLNTSTATLSGGIGTSIGCTITASTAHGNTTTATRSQLTGMGFYLGPSNTIQGCTASNNAGNGIHLNRSSLARDNNCASNGSPTGGGAGIFAYFVSNRIEGNNVVENTRGIEVNNAGNVIVRNTARGNTVNYVIAANNVFGAIVDRTAPACAAVSGNSAPSSAGTTDPLANISY